jgi:hypothetical protein
MYIYICIETHFFFLWCKQNEKCSIKAEGDHFVISTMPGAKNPVSIRTTQGLQVLKEGESATLQHGDLIGFGALC